MSIEIIKTNNEFSFYHSGDLYAVIRHYVAESNIEYFKFCSICRDRIDRISSYIFIRLMESGLLEQDYKPICCFCKLFEDKKRTRGLVEEHPLGFQQKLMSTYCRD